MITPDYINLLVIKLRFRISLAYLLKVIKYKNYKVVLNSTNTKMNNVFMNDFHSGFTPANNRVMALILGMLCLIGLFGVSLYSFIWQQSTTVIQADINPSTSTQSKQSDQEVRFVPAITPPVP